MGCSSGSKCCSSSDSSQVDLEGIENQYELEEPIPEHFKVGVYDSKNVQPVEVKKHSNHVLKTLFSPQVFWSHSGIRQPVAVFLILYYAIFVFYITRKDLCIDPATMMNNTFVDPNNCVKVNETTASMTKQKFAMEVAQYSKMHIQASKILTFFLGFYVANMMKRWWDQVSSLPDITQVAMALNGLVKTKEGSMTLKKTILRYCLLSYNAVMIQITKMNPDNPMPAPEEKGLLLAEETEQFNVKNSRHWWVPINSACTLVQDQSDMIKDGKEVVAAIGKFQQSLAKLMKFHQNPLPTLCEQVVHLASWMYVILGSFALQDCSQTVEWYTPLLDFPVFSLLNIIVLFAWLKMGSICTSPFDGDDFYDLDMKKALDVQVFNASMALYKDEQRRR